MSRHREQYHYQARMQGPAHSYGHSSNLYSRSQTLMDYLAEPFSVNSKAQLAAVASAAAAVAEAAAMAVTNANVPTGNLSASFEGSLQRTRPGALTTNPISTKQLLASRSRGRENPNQYPQGSWVDLSQPWMVCRPPESHDGRFHQLSQTAHNAINTWVGEETLARFEEPFDSRIDSKTEPLHRPLDKGGEVQDDYTSLRHHQLSMNRSSRWHARRLLRRSWSMWSQFLAVRLREKTNDHRAHRHCLRKIWRKWRSKTTMVAALRRGNDIAEGHLMLRLLYQTFKLWQAATKYRVKEREKFFKAEDRVYLKYIKRPFLSWLKITQIRNRHWEILNKLAIANKSRVLQAWRMQARRQIVQSVGLERTVERRLLRVTATCFRAWQRCVLDSHHKHLHTHIEQLQLQLLAAQGQVCESTTALENERRVNKELEKKLEIMMESAQDQAFAAAAELNQEQNKRQELQKKLDSLINAVATTTTTALLSTKCEEDLTASSSSQTQGDQNLASNAIGPGQTSENRVVDSELERIKELKGDQDQSQAGGKDKKIVKQKEESSACEEREADCIQALDSAEPANGEGADSSQDPESRQALDEAESGDVIEGEGTDSRQALGEAESGGGVEGEETDSRQDLKSSGVSWPNQEQQQEEATSQNGEASSMQPANGSELVGDDVGPYDKQQQQEVTAQDGEEAACAQPLDEPTLSNNDGGPQQELQEVVATEPCEAAALQPSDGHPGGIKASFQEQKQEELATDDMESLG